MVYCSGLHSVVSHQESTNIDLATIHRRRRARSVGLIAIVLACLAYASHAVHADSIELVDGTRYEGKLVVRTATHAIFKAETDEGAKRLSVPLEDVKSVRRTPKARPAPPVAGETQPTSPVGGPATVAHHNQAPCEQPAGRSRAEVEALIAQAPRTQPEWWDSVELDYPETLDLTDKVKVEGWKPDIKLGAYLISRVGPDPSKWRPAIKLLHHVLTVRKDDRKGLTDATDQLATHYFKYEKDYARAAFWSRKAAAMRSRDTYGNLLRQAECYWRLGNTAMTDEVLKRFGKSPKNPEPIMRLLGKMGRSRQGLAMAGKLSETRWSQAAWLAAGDLCRTAGNWDKAAQYYGGIVAMTKSKAKPTSVQRRARDSLAGVQALAGLDISQVPDGTHVGRARGYRGPVSLQVAVKSGRIESVKIARTGEDLPSTALQDIPARIVAKQGIAGVDAVTGATFTSEAIINATAAALAGPIRTAAAEDKPDH